MNNVKISVRHLAEFLLRSGDIDAGSASLQDVQVMWEGSEAHKKLQKQGGAAYQAEVSLKMEVILDEDLSITVEGRADGVIEENRLRLDMGSQPEGDAGALPSTGVLIPFPADTDRVLKKQKRKRKKTDRQADAQADSQTGCMEQFYTIDEIKGTYRNLKRIEQAEPVHLGQALCYAYLYAQREGLSQIGVQVTYVHLKSRKIKRFTRTWTYEALRKWFMDLLEAYAVWMRWSFSWQEERNRTIKEMNFPFPYRTGQKRMVAGVYQTVRQEKRLFIQAPTGTGKTMSVLYPSIKLLGERKTGKIFYLTAKTITRTVAMEAFDILGSRGLQFIYLVLTAKEKCCILDTPACNPRQCPRAKGHFDRINEAVFDLITHERQISREVIGTYAEKHRVCPYELQLEASDWVDGIICDYNYIFDPDGSLKRFSEQKQEKNILLIDEAHNLVERAREMFSASISRTELENYRKQFRKTDPKLATALNRCIRYLKETQKAHPECMELEACGTMAAHLSRVMAEIEPLLRPDGEDQKAPDSAALMKRTAGSARRMIEEGPFSEEEPSDGEGPADGEEPFSGERAAAGEEPDEGEDWVSGENWTDQARPAAGEASGGNQDLKKDPASYENRREELLRLYLSARCFVHAYEAMSADRYLEYGTPLGAHDYMLKILCVDPSKDLEAGLRMGAGTVFFSATLLPVQYYKSLLSESGNEDYDLYVDSPFDYKENCLIAVASDVSSRYTRRNQQEYERISDYIRDTARAKNGNYLVFFPSYVFMQNVFSVFSDRELQKAGNGFTVLMQESGMDEAGRQQFLEAFHTNADSGTTLLGFGVLGGIFSEGIDLREDQLIGVIIVGTGLPGMGEERELLRAFYDRKNGGGFEYAYLYPGMNKVLQAGGRVIRTEHDRGVILLLDDRFYYRQYRELLPTEWSPLRHISRTNAQDMLNEFWEKNL